MGLKQARYMRYNDKTSPFFSLAFKATVDGNGSPRYLFKNVEERKRKCKKKSSYQL